MALIDKVDELKGKLDRMKMSKLGEVLGLKYDDIIKNGYEKEEFSANHICGYKRFAKWKVRSNKKTWKYLCGSEVEYVVCEGCQTVISEKEIVGS